jgi:acyl carrier protein
MNATETKLGDRVTETIASVFNVTPEMLCDNASPATLPNWDSLSHLNMVMALESEFGVCLSADDALEMRDIASVRRILKARGVA